MDFCEKICNFTMSNWNDGISNAYILKQDDKFWYYMLKGYKSKRLGLLSKKYISNVALCKKSEHKPTMAEDYSLIYRESFVNRPVDLLWGRQIPLEKIVKIEGEFV